MSGLTGLGKLLLFAGLIIAGIGLLMLLFPKSLHWFGRLPGDIRIIRENVRFYFPVTSLLLLSAILSLILYIIGRFK